MLLPEHGQKNKIITIAGAPGQSYGWHSICGNTGASIAGYYLYLPSRIRFPNDNSLH